MEILDKLTDKLRRHVWCAIVIVGALVTIVWMAAFAYASKGSDIASWGSIFLALAVIMYMFFESYRSGQSLSEMRELIREGQNILAGKADQLRAQVESMKEQQQKFADSLLQQRPQLVAETKAPERPEFRLNIGACTWVQLLGLYSIVKSFKSKRALNLNLLATIVYEEPGFRAGTPAHFGGVMFLSGLFTGITCFLEADSVAVGAFGIEAKKDFPNNTAQLIIERLQQQIDDAQMSDPDRRRLQKLKHNIDAYVAAIG